ncbi:MAG: helix-turn-helix transcriptional regulator [Proteobacteria bacterium]|nr:helix-turn-helix transcriptional regulator [Pseudomonadota bacterium]
MDDIEGFGPKLKFWRQNRRFSQLDLAQEAGLSTRHLSFLETGRAGPSREMLMRLVGALALPLREADALLLAAGFSPAHRSHAASDPYQAIEAPLAMLLEGHHPFPAVAIDRYWNIRKANRAVAPLLAGVAPELLAGPINAVRLSLHPGGILPRILNAYQWREHLLQRLRQQFRLTADPALGSLIAEALAYPAPSKSTHAGGPPTGPVIPMRMRFGDAVLNFISTTTVFGTPLEVEVSELAIETFFPADEVTRQALIAMG